MRARNRFANSIDLSNNISPQPSRRRNKPFVPLKDLLQRNHDDRVREYLDKMKGLSIDDIVNTSILNKAPETPNKSNHGDAMFGGVTSPQGVRSNPTSHLSMGVTPKQVSIIEDTRTKARGRNLSK